jgi:D-3-phosphoglycerate dehydrogenase
MMAARPDIRLDKLDNETPDEFAAPILAAAHAFQIGSARDEIATKYHVTRDLLRRAPKLLIVSTNGAGFDPVDLAACTEAGVLVFNQAGGNKEACSASPRGSAKSTAPCDGRPCLIATPSLGTTWPAGRSGWSDWATSEDA